MHIFAFLGMFCCSKIHD